ncbi:bcl-2-like protein 1 [Takifugu rubripes]|uniref:BCL2 like 1 n=1 Tax=Takifugu rubripes TaxID=31033 RepID=H2U5I3_TAKRU|nr:bcl-2-like protein 1 [Takifugu rubripes]XP_011612630.2 bcl-2-like protein 1 [Takifugu rubripes]
MSYNNRELVEHFLRYKLSQRNYPTSLLRPEDTDGRTEGEKRSPAASNGLLVRSRNRGGASPSAGAGIEAVNAALRDSAEEFEKLFAQAFSDLSSQLDITPDTAYQSFKNVMDEVFKDGVNWGRVVGLFAFGGVLCVECVEKDASQLVCRIADWMTIYLDEHINPWIQSQGGWDCFAKIFGDDAAAEGRRARENLSRWMLGGLALLMGVLVGAFIVKKH